MASKEEREAIRKGIAGKFTPYKRDGKIVYYPQKYKRRTHFGGLHYHCEKRDE